MLNMLEGWSEMAGTQINNAHVCMSICLWRISAAIKCYGMQEMLCGVPVELAIRLRQTCVSMPCAQ